MKKKHSDIITYDKAKKIWSQIAKNTQDLPPNFELEIHKKLLNVFQVGDYYHYIFNCTTQQIEFTHSNILNVLGYNDSEFTIDLLMSIIHPEDFNYFINFEQAVTDFFNKLNPEKTLKYKVRYDYRIKKITGEYIRILQQVVTLQTDEKGAVIRVLGIHTDISHLKQTNESSLSFIGLDGEPSFHNVKVKSILKPSVFSLTNREKEVLLHMLSGKRSIDISEILCISKHTVDSHRKNILSKTHCKSITELISKALKEKWL